MNHLEAFLNAMKADAALVHRPENLRWLAGYTGEEHITSITIK